VCLAITKPAFSQKNLSAKTGNISNYVKEIDSQLNSDFTRIALGKGVPLLPCVLFLAVLHLVIWTQAFPSSVLYSVYSESSFVKGWSFLIYDPLTHTLVKALSNIGYTSL